MMAVIIELVNQLGEKPLVGIQRWKIAIKKQYCHYRMMPFDIKQEWLV
jgi:hypothetical protein